MEIRYIKYFKPKGCPVRKLKPVGPLKLCGGICEVFEACIELTRAWRERERDMEELKGEVWEDLSRVYYKYEDGDQKRAKVRQK